MGGAKERALKSKTEGSNWCRNRRRKERKRREEKEKEKGLVVGYLVCLINDGALHDPHNPEACYYLHPFNLIPTTTLT